MKAFKEFFEKEIVENSENSESSENLDEGKGTKIKIDDLIKDLQHEKKLGAKYVYIDGTLISDYQNGVIASSKSQW